MLLKADFHIHTREDKENNILYNAKELIDNAYKKGFDVISITNHNLITFSKELKEYARKKNIILIPGCEISINRKHVLLINIEDFGSIKKIDDIKKLKKKNNLIIAPHPYFPGMQSIGSLLNNNKDIFDAVELCHFYSPKLNFNREAIRFANKNNIPLIANSDSHIPEQFGNCYSYIDAEKEINSIINAVKKGKISVYAPPLSIFRMILIYLKIIKNKKSFYKIFQRLTGIAIRLFNIKDVKRKIK